MMNNGEVQQDRISNLLQKASQLSPREKSPDDHSAIDIENFGHYHNDRLLDSTITLPKAIRHGKYDSVKLSQHSTSHKVTNSKNFVYLL